MTDTLSTTTAQVRANTAAVAWLNAFLATSDDPQRPVLNKTIAVEFFPRGVQFISTDGSVLIRTWVPEVGHGTQAAPHPDLWPDHAVVVMDPEGFGLAFMRSLARVTNDEARAWEPLHITIEPMDDGATLDLGPQFACERLVLRACGQRIDLKLYENEFPNWRALKFGTDDVERVPGLRIATRMFQIVGKLKGVSMVDLDFHGTERRVEFTARGVEAEVHGILMPMRRDQLPKSSKDEGEVE